MLVSTLVGLKGRVGAEEYDVRGFDMLRVQHPHSPGDHHAPVAALSHVFVIAESQHELVAGLGVLVEVKTFLFASFREAIVRYRWRDHMESWNVFAIARC